MQEWQRKYLKDAEEAAAMRQKQNAYTTFDPITQPEPVHQPRQVSQQSYDSQQSYQQAYHGQHGGYNYI